MRLLALETATEACSVALSDGRELSWRYQHAPRRQTELLLPMVDELLAAAQWPLSSIDVFAYSAGPGAFSGVRLGAAAVQGLAFACQRPVLAVSSLQALAQGAWRRHGAERILALFDARMQEVYAGFYRVSDGLAQALLPERVAAIATLTDDASGPWFAVGNGLAARQQLHLPLCGEDAELWPHAEDVLHLAWPRALAGQAQDPALALPVYLRDDVWQKLPGR